MADISLEKTLPSNLEAERAILLCAAEDTAFGPLGPVEIAGVTGAKGDKGDTGAAGAAGAKWFPDEGAPSDSVGANGDMYLDVTSGDVYQKAAGTWGTAVGNIKGPAGG